MAALTPRQIAKIRTRIAQLVRLQLPEAHAVVMGERQWTPTQANVFKTLIAKVIPDVSATFSQVDLTVKDSRTLTREELEAIAKGDDEDVNLEKGEDFYEITDGYDDGGPEVGPDDDVQAAVASVMRARARAPESA